MRLNEISEPIPGYTDRERQIKALQVLGRKHPERALPKIKEWLKDLSAIELAKLVNDSSTESEKDGSIGYREQGPGTDRYEVWVIGAKDVDKFVTAYNNTIDNLPASTLTSSYDELIDAMTTAIYLARDNYSYEHTWDDGYEGA